MNSTLIGLGTYNSHPKQDAVVRMAIEKGFTHIDTAPNYNSGNSQRLVGEAINNFKRHYITISSKVGFVSSTLKKEKYIRTGVVNERDFFHSHCLKPAFIENEIKLNLKELQRDHIDILFLHNPEVQLQHSSRNELMQLLRKNFETLETFSSEGVVGSYGISTWDGFGVNGKSAKFTLDEVLEVANSVSTMNKFKAIQLPISIIQFDHVYDYIVNDTGLLMDIRNANLDLYISSPLHHGELPKIINKSFSHELGTSSVAQACLKFLKSIPFSKTILVGMTREEHMDENLELYNQQSIELDKMEEILYILKNGRAS